MAPRGGRDLLPAATKAMLKAHLPSARFALQPASCWSTARLHKKGAAAELFPDGEVPRALARRLAAPADNAAALAAFAGMHAFLQASMLDSAVLSLKRVEELYPEAQDGGSVDAETQAEGGTDAAMAGPEERPAAAALKPLLLDGAALANLEARLLRLCPHVLQAVLTCSHALQRSHTRVFGTRALGCQVPCACGRLLRVQSR